MFRTTPRSTDAVRVEFVRSIFLLPQDDEGNAVAFTALKDFITSTAVPALTGADLERLEHYLKDAVLSRATTANHADRLVEDIAFIARRATRGEVLFAEETQARNVG